MKPRDRVFAVVLLGLSTAGWVGCGGGSGLDVAPVTGKVTLDKQPLANARVLFSHTSMRESVGVTDDKGQYTLKSGPYASALVGSHKVKITTAREAVTEHSETEGYKTVQEAVAEKLPPKYNTESELKAEVKAGGNTIDFALSSQ